MRIVYDNIIFASQRYGGISVVWGELLRRAIWDGHDVDFVEFTPTDNLVRQNLYIPPEHIRTVPVAFRKAFKYLPVRVYGDKPFIFHSSFFRTCNNPNAVNITTVHDFTNEMFQTGSGPRKERWIKHNAIRHSDYIICISENTRKDFFRYFPNYPEDHVKVIYHGVSEDFCQLKNCGPLPFPQDSYLLFVGAREGYKQFDIIPEVLRQSGLNLVFTGSPLSGKEKRQLSGLEDRCHYAGGVSVGDLNRLYNGAFALVYPSQYEGFGLPVIEAQRAGCPVIACDASSIPEIIGDTPLLMERPSTDRLLQKIELLKDPDIRRTVIGNGLRNSRRFSWENMYRSTLALYDAALNDKH